MNIDKGVRILLAVIALALWVNALNPWVRHSPVSQGVDVRQIHSDLSEIRLELAKVELNTELVLPVLRGEILPELKKVESYTGQIELNTATLQGR